ncbi:MAG: LON peptidase substrate-binding domain-containing protein [Bacteriovoracaceae bacterium]|jgi:uncharacterized protein|nr:LON peptidase substrate-binding domain-containing protein [Bacteriovoracaceae bacterium]
MSNKFRVSVLPVPEVVFYPNTVLPIYIMESAYIKMVQDAVTNNELIGISLAQPIKNQRIGERTKFTPSDICSIGSPVIVAPLNEGTLKILIKGVKRVKLLSIHQNLPFLIFEAEDFIDEQKATIMSGGEVERLRTILELWLIENINDTIERESFNENLKTLSHIVDYICMFLIQDVMMRQSLLENNCLGDRVRILNLLLKDCNPFEEDLLIVDAFKDFEKLEKYAKAEH